MHWVPKQERQHANYKMWLNLMYCITLSLPQSQDNGDKERFMGIPPVDEKGVKKEIGLFLKTVKKLRGEYMRELYNPMPREEDEAASPIGYFCVKTVGLSDQSEKIRNELLDLQPGPKNVSLVGMAGIGKTHLAREIYQHPIIVRNFHFRVWVSVGIKGHLQNIFVDIVAQIENKPKELYMRVGLSELAELLQKSLHGRRYLIVLDDIWNTGVLKYLISWLPAGRNGRRFLLTTRLEGVAEYLDSSIHQMPFLNNDESWNLLWQNVFRDKCFPRQLEKAGRKIAENCEGLPLLILAVANMLCGLEKTEEYWKKVADKKTTTFTDAYDRISKVLSSSYENLPQRLKACFLYMGVFPQSSEIPVSKLINLWIVEDFLEPIQDLMLEESYENSIPRCIYQDFVGRRQDRTSIAMECLKELVSHSLAIICKSSSDYRIKSCRLHSAYWHLCIKEARKNKFLLVLNKLTDASKYDIASQRRLSVQNNILFGIKEVYDSMAATLTARSLLCTGEDHEYPVPICFNLMFLKVLDALAIRFYEFPVEVLKLVQLRYLALTHNGKLPSSISKLLELQCLIVRRHHNIKVLRDSTYLPTKIWDMKELRHLWIIGSNLPDPSYRAKLPNLLRLYVNAHSCTKGVFRSIPHLKKLRIVIELQPDTAETLSCFEHVCLLDGIESIKCVVVNPRLRSQVFAPPYHLLNMPWGLKKLSLNGLGYSWEHLRAISSLPNLEVLKLQCSAFQGPEWETEFGDFQILKFLLLEDNDLMHWTVKDDCFRCLECLIIRHCYKLKEIPSQIGGIPTLKRMEVVDCSPSVVASAQRIQEKTNPSVQVVIKSSWSLRR